MTTESVADNQAIAAWRASPTPILICIVVPAIATVAFSDPGGDGLANAIVLMLSFVATAILALSSPSFHRLRQERAATLAELGRARRIRICGSLWLAAYDLTAIRIQSTFQT